MSLNNELKNILSAIRSLLLKEEKERISESENIKTLARKALERSDVAILKSELSKWAVKEIPNHAFDGRKDINFSFLDLPSLETIGENAFRGCTRLSLDSIPKSVTTIGSGAFEGCSALKNITFLGTPSVISETAFSSCENLTVINVPWAEGEVENSPWGANNAKISFGISAQKE